MTALLRECNEEALNCDGAVPANDAVILILEGRAPANMRVKGPLNLSSHFTLTHIPTGLQTDSIDLSDCRALESLPADLKTRRLNLSGCTGLRELPAGLHCNELNLNNTRLRALPADLRVDFRLDCTGCVHLETLPVGLKVGSLILRDCTSLETLPEGLDVSFLDISGCLGMRCWPQQAKVQVGRLVARGCMQFTSLPDWLADVSQLDLSGCANITELPPTLQVRSWIDIANTGIAFLPPGVANAQIRWRGVTIDSRIAFEPETINSQEILGTVNVELRRVLMERMSYEAFMANAQAQILDTDADPGGERQLLRVPIANDEPLVCLSVSCPSTDRQYMLRVPPDPSHLPPGRRMAGRLRQRRRLSAGDGNMRRKIRDKRRNYSLVLSFL